jgi:signal transduction histidine kinase
MLADVVRERRSEVLDFARKRLAELMPERPAQDAGDYLPSLLDHIVAHIGDPRVNADDDGAIAASAAHHGRQAHQRGTDIHFVVHDIGVICESVAEIAGRAGVTIAPADWQKLNRALDVAIAHAVSSYEALRDKERRRSAADLGSVAHELRNALAAATVAFEAVKRGRVGTDSRTADIVTRNLKRGALLARNLVVQSKVEARPELILAPFALWSIVDDVVATVPAVVTKTEIRVASDIVVVADEELLISALTNLVQNAVKFTQPGGTVTVRARQSADSIAIEVEDGCGGLPPGKAETLFAPFVQHRSDRRGAGLGLSIVLKIMLAHGGSVRVQDLPGRGCVFELSFPRRLPR